MKNELIEKIDSRKAQVGVIGPGYVGLPLAVELASAGYRVIGVDVSEKVVELVGRGESHVGDVPSERLAPLVEQELIRPTTDYARLADADCISICVPTPLRKTKEPDIYYITAAVDGLAPYLCVGRLVVLESTTYPGTTEELIASKIGAGRRETADFLPGEMSVVLA